MKKQDFFSALDEYLELSGLNEDSTLELTSLGILSVIVIVDENFDKQLNASELKDIKCMSELMNLIGFDNFLD